MASVVEQLSRVPQYVAYLRRMRRSVDGPLAERVVLAKRTLERGGWWRQPMRLPQRGGKRPSAQIEVGERVFVGKHAWINLTSPTARLVIGDGTVIGNSFSVTAGARVEVGNGVMMSDRVTLLDQLHDFRGWVARALAEGREPACDWGLTDAAPVRIGSGTWLGIGVVVLPGVAIGKGCAVGANAVVTGDLPDFSVAVGLPARIIGDARDGTSRASVETVERSQGG